MDGDCSCEDDLHIDNLLLCPFTQQRQEYTRHHVYTRDVSVENLVQIFDGLHAGRTNCLDAGVVDQYVKGPGRSDVAQLSLRHC